MRWAALVSAERSSDAAEDAIKSWYRQFDLKVSIPFLDGCFSQHYPLHRMSYLPMLVIYSSLAKYYLCGEEGESFWRMMVERRDRVKRLLLQVCLVGSSLSGNASMPSRAFLS